jgi:hypothetical protein
LRAFLPAPLADLSTLLLLGSAAVLLVQWARRAKEAARNDRELELLFAGMVLIGSVLAPDFFYYDAVMLLLPALMLYEVGAAEPTARVLLAAAYAMSWSYVVFAQPLFLQLPAPWPLVSAPWVVVPLIGLFEVAQQMLRPAVAAHGSGHVSIPARSTEAIVGD